MWCMTLTKIMRLVLVVLEDRQDYQAIFGQRKGRIGGRRRHSWPAIVVSSSGHVKTQDGGRRSCRRLLFFRKYASWWMLSNAGQARGNGIGPSRQHDCRQ